MALSEKRPGCVVVSTTYIAVAVVDNVMLTLLAPSAPTKDLSSTVAVTVAVGSCIALGGTNGRMFVDWVWLVRFVTVITATQSVPLAAQPRMFQAGISAHL